MQCLNRNLDTVKIFKRLMELREYGGIGMIVDDNEARTKCMQMNKRKNTKLELVISDSGITANEKKIILSMSMIKENERETLEDEERAKKAEKFSIL